MTSKLDVTQSVTFIDGEFISSSINLGDNGTLEGLETPLGFKTTDITFSASIDDTTYKCVDEASGKEAILCAVSANRFRVLGSIVTKGVKFLKLKREGVIGEETIKVIIRHVI